MESFFSVGLLLLFAVCVCLVIFAASRLLGPTVKFPSKLKPYECGVATEGSARQPFKTGFYLVAVLFLLFDVEVAFLFPWALIYRESVAQGPSLLIGGLFYLGLVVLGMIYILKKNVLKVNP